jgi:hypothetical protein
VGGTGLLSYTESPLRVETSLATHRLTTLRTIAIEMESDDQKNQSLQEATLRNKLHRPNYHILSFGI